MTGYGLVFDPTERTLAQMYGELDVILSTPEIPLPLFTFLAIPFPGTPVFRDKYEQGLLLPNMKMRDWPFYRIRHEHHYRTGDAWSLYPLYDFAHCLSDHIEGMC